MQHHYALDNLMFPTFAKAVKKIAISEMRHAEMLSERIRELGGIPIVAPAQNVDTNQEPMVVFATDADLERDTVFKYNEYIQKLSEIDHLTQLGPHYLAVQAGGAFNKKPTMKSSS